MRKTLTQAFCLLTLLSLSAISVFAKENETTTPQQFQKKPLVFLENKGQVTDQNGKVRNDISFRIPAQGLNIFVASGAVHYQWTRTLEYNAKDPEATIPTEVYRLDMELEGANKNVIPVTADANEYFENYYLPNKADAVTAHAFEKVIYKNIYPSIDWVLYSKNGHLKYDFIVHPGGNPNDIKIKYAGNTGREMLPDGDVKITTPYGSITEQKLLCFDSKGNTIPSHITSTDIHHMQFSVADYTGTLTIDPQVEWSTYYGGTTDEYGFTVATDTSGGAYIAGWTTSTGNIATAGTHQTSISGSRDAFVARFSKTCARLWGTYYGGTGNDDFFSCTLDTAGFLYAAGITTSSGLASGSAHQSTIGGGKDCILAKFHPANGTRVWATYYGGTQNEGLGAIEYQVSVGCDSKNRIYLCGNTQSVGANVIATSGAAQINLTLTPSAPTSPRADGFLARFDENGTRVWGTYYGDTAEDRIIKIIFDKADNVYVAGETKSPGTYFGTPNRHKATYAGGSSDVFFSKFAPDGKKIWSTYFGGMGNESPEGLAVDAFGFIYMSGSTASNNGISTLGSYMPSKANPSSPEQDCFLTKFDTAGTQIWGTYYGGTNVDHCGDMAMDAFGNICFTGYTASENGISTPGVPQPQIAGSNYDAFLAIFTLNGIRYWASYIGGTGADFGYGLKYSKYGDLYLVGNTQSSGGIATSTTNTYQTSLSGTNDAFLTKYQADTSTFIIYPFNVTNVCAGDTFYVNYGITNPFRNGNTFYVQMSDDNGNFSNPDTIGSLISTNTGTIRCIVTKSTPDGNNYKIRIVSSRPGSTSLESITGFRVRALPAKPVAGSNTPVCDGGAPLNLTSNSTTPLVSYSWIGPNGFISGLKNPSITNPPIAASGNYVVTATLNGCATKDTTAVVVNITPAKPTVGSNSPVCDGGTLNLTATTTTTGCTFSWRGPDNFTSNDQNPTRPGVNTLSAGYYVVTAARISCTSTDSVNVVIAPTFTPVVNVSVNPSDTICMGDTLTFISTATGGGPTPTYKWRQNGTVIPGATGNTYTSANFTNNDIIDVIYTGSGPCLTIPADTTDPVNITVVSSAVPAVGISINPGVIAPHGTFVLFTALDTNGGGFPTFKWFKNGTAIPGALSQVLPQYMGDDLKTGDQICVTMTSSLSCAEPDTATTCAPLIEVTTDVRGITKNTELNLYPNPNGGIFTLEGYVGTSKDISLEILNVLGQSVYKGLIKPTDRRIRATIDLGASAANGIYLLHMKTDTELKQLKFTLRR